MQVGAYLKSRGFKNVNALEGGVNAYVSYVQKNKKEGDSLFVGSNMVFDNRKRVQVTSDVLSKCHQCGDPCNKLQNCSVHKCDVLMIQCERCAEV